MLFIQGGVRISFLYEAQNTISQNLCDFIQAFIYC
uniref:Uncharacterized protein n=1 Tax=Magnetococcus massalia (strain MO-1) TaxID=451514 RepID=A0A1S7LKF0_MAGMO|nr:protein of unknown function [Candidatus Magnetococcus massalia]